MNVGIQVWPVVLYHLWNIFDNIVHRTVFNLPGVTHRASSTPAFWWLSNPCTGPRSLSWAYGTALPGCASGTQNTTMQTELMQCKLNSCSPRSDVPSDLVNGTSSYPTWKPKHHPPHLLRSQPPTDWVSKFCSLCCLSHLPLFLPIPISWVQAYHFSYGFLQKIYIWILVASLSLIHFYTISKISFLK